MGHSKLADIINTLDLDKANEIIKNAYRSRFKGDWDTKSEFRFHNGHISLFSPAYTKYMLFGRPSGKMPPSQPIEDWIRRYNIKASSWAVRYKIAKEGTSTFGTNKNDFISPVLPQVVQSVKLDLVPKLTKAILSELSQARKRK